MTESQAVLQLSLWIFPCCEHLIVSCFLPEAPANLKLQIITTYLVISLDSLNGQIYLSVTTRLVTEAPALCVSATSRVVLIEEQQRNVLIALHAASLALLLLLRW